MIFQAFELNNIAIQDASPLAWIIKERSFGELAVTFMALVATSKNAPFAITPTGALQAKPQMREL